LEGDWGYLVWGQEIETEMQRQLAQRIWFDIPALIQTSPKNRWSGPFEVALDPKCSLALIYGRRVFIVCIFFCPDTFLRSFSSDTNESFRCKREIPFLGWARFIFFIFGLGWAIIHPDHPLY